MARAKGVSLDPLQTISFIKVELCPPHVNKKSHSYQWLLMNLYTLVESVGFSVVSYRVIRPGTQIMTSAVRRVVGLVWEQFIRWWRKNLALILFAWSAAVMNI